MKTKDKKSLYRVFRNLLCMLLLFQNMYLMVNEYSWGLAVKSGFCKMRRVAVALHSAAILKKVSLQAAQQGACVNAQKVHALQQQLENMISPFIEFYNRYIDGRIMLIGVTFFGGFLLTACAAALFIGKTLSSETLAEAASVCFFVGGICYSVIVFIWLVVRSAYKEDAAAFETLILKAAPYSALITQNKKRIIEALRRPDGHGWYVLKECFIPCPQLKISHTTHAGVVTFYLEEITAVSA